MGRLWELAPANERQALLPAPGTRWALHVLNDKAEAVVTTFGPFSTALDLPRQAACSASSAPKRCARSLGGGVGGRSRVKLAIYADRVPEVLGRAFP